MRVRVEWTAGIFRFQATIDSESEKDQKNLRARLKQESHRMQRRIFEEPILDHQSSLPPFLPLSPPSPSLLPFLVVVF